MVEMILRYKECSSSRLCPMLSLMRTLNIDRILSDMFQQSNSSMSSQQYWKFSQENRSCTLQKSLHRSR
jgi:hypothetical protein